MSVAHLGLAAYQIRSQDQEENQSQGDKAEHELHVTYLDDEKELPPSPMMVLDSDAEVVQFNDVPKQLKGVDVSRVARLHQRSNPLFGEPATTPEDIECVEVSSQIAHETSIVWHRSEEESVIYSRQMKPIGWMKKQKKAGNLSSEQFQALKHLRNKEEVVPKESRGLNAGVKRQSRAETNADNNDNIPALPSPGRLRSASLSVKNHSSKHNRSQMADDKQDVVARIKKTRQARIAKDKAKDKFAQCTIVNV